MNYYQSVPQKQCPTQRHRWRDCSHIFAKFVQRIQIVFVPERWLVPGSVGETNGGRNAIQRIHNGDNSMDDKNLARDHPPRGEHRHSEGETNIRNNVVMNQGKAYIGWAELSQARIEPYSQWQYWTKFKRKRKLSKRASQWFSTLIAVSLMNALMVECCLHYTTPHEPDCGSGAKPWTFNGTSH